MKRTAYFHPALAEELSLLTPDARIHFYSLASRDATSYFNLDRYDNYHIDGQLYVDRIVGPAYFEVMPIPKTCVAIDGLVMKDSNLYLHLKIDDGSLDKSAFDEALIATSRKRLAQLKEKDAEALSFFEFTDLHADPAELKEANRINIGLSQTHYYRRLMIMAYEDTLSGYKSLFNLSDTRMERVMTRFDGFFKSFNDNLEKRSGGRVNIVVNFRDEALFDGKSFKELTRSDLDDGHLDERTSGEGRI